MINFTNRYLWNSNSLEDITGGKNSTYWECNKVEIDSRKIKKGNLFLALTGKKFDGHDFIESAMLGGASAVMLTNKLEKKYKKFSYIAVRDVYKSFVLLSQEARKRAEELYKTKFIAITGSSGKTSTKEMMKKVFGDIAKTYANPASFNNHIGVPYSLVNIPRHTKFGIFEIGMNKPNEVNKLSSLVKPHIAIITNISESHLGNFSSMQDIISAKSEIFNALGTGGYALVYRDKMYFEKIKYITKELGINNLVTFGQTSESDVYLSFRKVTKEGQSIVANVFGKEYAYKINLEGFHQVLNSLSVLAVANILGLDINKILSSFSSIKTPIARGTKHKIYIKNKESLLIDDSYNANPSSVEASLRMLVEVAKQNRTIFIFGDMKELGKFSEKLHERIAKIIYELKIDLLFCIGEETKIVYKSLKNYSKVFWFKNFNDFKKSAFEDMLLPADTILIKGSRVMKMEKVVKYILKNCKMKVR